MFGIRRREFITLLGGAAASWPLSVRAQQASMPVVGFLHSGSPRPYAGRMAGFRQGLGDTGFVEGKDVALEYRWAEGNYERLPQMALESGPSRSLRDCRRWRDRISPCSEGGDFDHSNCVSLGCRPGGRGTYHQPC